MTDTTPKRDYLPMMIRVDKERAARDARRAALEDAAKRYEEGDDWDTFASAAAAIRSLIDDTGPSIADELAQARGFIKDYQRQLSEEMVRSSVAEAKLAKVQEALDDLAIRLGDPQRRYDKIGPTWTGKDGHEYSDMSELLDFATEISEQAAAIRALIDREPAPVVRREPAPVVRRVRHKKRGTTYEVLGEAELQFSAADARLIEEEGAAITVYRCEKTGKLWCRFTDEFEDGRFEPKEPTP